MQKDQNRTLLIVLDKLYSATAELHQVQEQPNITVIYIDAKNLST